MSAPSAAGLAEALRQYRVLEPAQLEEVARSLQAQFPDPRALARELVRRGWLTPYQANQLLLGRGPDLLLGSYVLLEKLGEGGMGAVFKARNWKLGHVVALKLIRKERLAGANALRRFQREIRAAAALEHPNIVRAHDADEVAGTHFLVMEYVEGTDLDRLVKQQGPVPAALACGYVRQAALGLQHAYERGLTHRDIKPHNLLLTRAGVVKLLDMGLARVEQDEGGESTSTMTQEGVVLGTPDFLAPEQAMRAHDVDTRADLYSLGCTLYYLLAGRVPFPGGTLMSKLLQHRLDEPEPLDRLRPGVPPAVVAVVRKLMAKRPEDRYQAPWELAEALAEVGEGGAPGPADAATLSGAEQPAAPAARPAAESGSTVDPLGALGQKTPAESAPSLPGGSTLLEQARRARRAAPGRSDRQPWLIAGGVAGALVLVGLLVALARPWHRAEAPRPDAIGSERGPGPAGRPGGGAVEPVDEAWIRSVAALPAPKQVEVVSAKLREFNPGFDGRVKPTYEKGAVVGLEFLTDRVTDVSPVQGLVELRTLSCRGSAAGEGQLPDLVGLRGLRLASLDCGANRLGDLSPLKGMPLRALRCDNTLARDLTPLKGMHLTALDCSSTPVKDLVPLGGMRLRVLDVHDTAVVNLAPVRNLPLHDLNCAGCPVPDLAPLRDLSFLRRLSCPVRTWGDADLLRSLKALESINQKPAVAFRKELDADRARFGAWAASVTKLPAGKQVEAVAARLKERNPGFDGKVTPTITKGIVTGLSVPARNVADISPVRALPGLRTLTCAGTFHNREGRLADLSPLRGLPLVSLDCNDTAVADLEPLRGMPLKDLRVYATRVVDLAPLRGMKLTSFSCGHTSVADLAPLAGMPLKLLHFDNTHVTDLSPVRAMPVTSLYCYGNRIPDLSPLRGLPLQVLVCDFNPWRDDEHIRPIKSLKQINWVPAAQIFKPLDAFEAWCRKVAQLPAGKQVEAVAAELKRRNAGFDGKVKPRIEGGAVTGLELGTAAVTDLAPLRALPRLGWLSLTGKGKVADLWPLKGLKLVYLRVSDNPVADLTPLRGMPLDTLYVAGTQVADLAPLRGMPLAYLDCRGTRVADLGPLRDLPLSVLLCDSTPVRDLGPLGGMGLTELGCQNTPVRDLFALTGMPLRALACDFNVWRDAGVVGTLPALQEFNHKAAGPFLKKLDADRAAFAAWAASVGKLPAGQQVAAVAAELKKRNPGFDGKVTPRVVKGVVVRVDLGPSGSRVTDLSPVRALPGLQELHCPGVATAPSLLTNLWALKGLRLSALNCSFSRVADLAPLGGMPLKRLACAGTPVADLAPLKGMPLESLNCNQTQVADLAPLKGTPLQVLYCFNTKVTDLAPLEGMRLTVLSCAATKVTDLAPLRGMPLKSLYCKITRVADLAPLKGLPLTVLECAATRVSNLAPLQGMRLQSLVCNHTEVRDLAPLGGMPLTSLVLHDTPVADLSPLRRTGKLQKLDCQDTDVSDLSPLVGLPLRELQCDFRRSRDTGVLRAVPTLQTVNDRPAAQFWREVGGPPPRP
jgi:Leucine-rich repeat (LRR) protein/tRNA A-37 threonylcarbamoyl transferase component Bud32